MFYSLVLGIAVIKRDVGEDKIDLLQQYLSNYNGTMDQQSGVVDNLNAALENVDSEVSQLFQEPICRSAIASAVEFVTNVTNIEERLDTEEMQQVAFELNNLNFENAYEFIYQHWNDVIDLLVPCSHYIGPQQTTAILDVSAELVLFESLKQFISELIYYYTDDNDFVQTIYDYMAHSSYVNDIIFELISRFDANEDMSIPLQSKTCRSAILSEIQKYVNDSYDTSFTVNLTTTDSFFASLDGIDFLLIIRDLDYIDGQDILTALNPCNFTTVTAFDISYENDEEVVLDSDKIQNALESTFTSLRVFRDRQLAVDNNADIADIGSIPDPTINDGGVPTNTESGFDINPSNDNSTELNPVPVILSKQNDTNSLLGPIYIPADDENVGIDEVQTSD